MFQIENYTTQTWQARIFKFTRSPETRSLERPLRCLSAWISWSSQNTSPKRQDVTLPRAECGTSRTKTFGFLGVRGEVSHWPVVSDSGFRTDSSDTTKPPDTNSSLYVWFFTSSRLSTPAKLTHESLFKVTKPGICLKTLQIRDVHPRSCNKKSNYRLSYLLIPNITLQNTLSNYYFSCFGRCFFQEHFPCAGEEPGSEGARLPACYREL